MAPLNPIKAPTWQRRGFERRKPSKVNYKGKAKTMRVAKEEKL
jgi:hypothetical protein